VIWRIHIQLRIAAVGQSLSGLWYTCVHAKQLQIDPMYMWVEKIIKNTPYSWDNARYINQRGVKGRKEQKKKKKPFSFKVPSYSAKWPQIHPFYNSSLKISLFNVLLFLVLGSFWLWLLELHKITQCQTLK